MSNYTHKCSQRAYKMSSDILSSGHGSIFHIRGVMVFGRKSEEHFTKNNLYSLVADCTQRRALCLIVAFLQHISQFGRSRENVVS